jgi:hypothetical protein
MVFMRAFFRGILLFLLLVAVAVWSVAMTLQMTLLNSDTVKGWVQQSGAYENIIDTLEIRQIDATGVVESSMLREAIKRAVPPAYIQTQTERVIDGAFVWIEGKAPAFTYDIPIHESRGEFIKQLGQLVEEKVKTLPRCTGSLGLSVECIPGAYTAGSYALSIANQTAQDSHLFEQPLTSKDTQQFIQTINMLPMIAAVSQTLSWMLPILIVLAGAGFVFLSQTWRIGMTRLGKQLVAGVTALVVLGGLLWTFGASTDLASRLFGGSDVALIAKVVEPIVRQAVVSIGMWLTIAAGSILVVGVVLWVIGSLLQRRQISPLS